MIKKLVIPAKAGIQRMLLIGLGILGLAACSSNQAPANLNMVISVSTDGNYAIATNTNKQAILWNLKDHTYKIVFKGANIYSAYFIKNTNDFIYQNDKTNEVMVEDVNDKIIKKFNPGFPTYGEAITSDLETYVAADQSLSVYKFDLKNNQRYVLNQSWCVQDHNGQDYKGSATSDCLNFMSSDQTFGLQFTPDQTKLIGANFFALFIWDLRTNTGTMIQKNDAQTFAAISPDSSYVITGDLDKDGYLYKFASPNQGILFGYLTPSDSTTKAYFDDPDQNTLKEILSVKFIDNQHLIMIVHGIPDLFNYAVLYDPSKMHVLTNNYPSNVLSPIKYLPLIDHPENYVESFDKSWPLTMDQFTRSQAIDTAPSAHILVMSMTKENGIIVYKYDPATQTLTREWAGTVKPWWKVW